MCICSCYLCCCSGQMDPTDLAHPDSSFLRVKGILVHYKLYENQQPLISKQNESTTQPIFILQHGFGANVSSWNRIMKQLSTKGTVLVFDRPAFGLTERKLSHQWKGVENNPYTMDFAADLPFLLLDTLGLDKQRPVVLVGHSMGAKCCVYSALKHKSSRNIRGLILCAPAVLSQPPAIAAAIAKACKSFMACTTGFIFKTFGTLAIRNAFHDPSKITAQDIKDYQLPLKCKDWQMGFVEMTIAQTMAPPFLQGKTVSSFLESLQDLPTLVIAGDDDKIVALNEQQQLAKQIPNSEIVVVKDCGHNVQEEHAERTINEMLSFLQKKSNIIAPVG